MNTTNIFAISEAGRTAIVWHGRLGAWAKEGWHWSETYADERLRSLRSNANGVYQSRDIAEASARLRFSA